MKAYRIQNSWIIFALMIAVALSLTDPLGAGLAKNQALEWEESAPALLEDESEQSLGEVLVTRLEFEQLGLELAGVSSFRGRKACCIRHPQDGHRQMVYNVGDIIGGFTIIEIQDQMVTFERNGQQFWILLEEEEEQELSEEMFIAPETAAVQDESNETADSLEPAAQAEPTANKEELDIAGWTEGSIDYKHPAFDLKVKTDSYDATLTLASADVARGGRVRPYARRSASRSQMFVLPVAGRLTSPYGYRRHPVGGQRSFHRGIDIAASYGRSVVSAADGVVTKVGTSYTLGKYIEISHAQGYTTLYAHLSRQVVKTGQRVSQGKVIGKIGSTGRSTGPHLHFGIKKNGRYVNPSSYVRVTR